MNSRMLVKRLTASDLTIFEWQFRNRPAGNQKSINLNRNVFIDILYPSLPTIADENDGRVPLDLFLYGPGLAGEYNLQRKILKGTSYKNWRLDGEFIQNPGDEPNRFNSMLPEDLIVIQFAGDLTPQSARAVLLASDIPEDQNLHRIIADWLNGSRMRAISSEVLDTLVEKASPEEQHPIHELTLEGELEDAALGGVVGQKRLYRRRSGGRMTRGSLERARKNAEQIGRLGEELVSVFFERRQCEASIRGFRWVSDENAVAPYDFEITAVAGERIKLDVKSTTGDFDRRIHVSLAELEEMVRSDERYDLYRLYELGGKGAMLRIAEDCRGFARGVLEAISSVPEGVMVDGVSVCPECLPFGREVVVSSSLDDGGNVGVCMEKDVSGES